MRKLGFFQRISTRVKTLFESGGSWTPFGSFVTIADWYRGKPSKTQLLTEYRNLVFSCIRAISQDVARYEPYVYRMKPDGQKEIIRNHPIIKLVENPNPSMSQFELFEATQTYMELTGEAFWYLQIGKLTGRPAAVFSVLRPDCVELVYSKNDQELIGYLYHVSPTNKIPLDIEEVQHFKNFNPENQRRGMGATEAGKLYVDIENETSNFQWGVLKNQASPAGVLSLKGNMTRAAFKKAKRQWKEQYGGTTNAGKTLFIRESEATFTKVGLSLTDLQIGELSTVNDEKIRKLFGVPREILGDTSNSGLGRANIEAIEYMYAKRTIDPKLTRFDDQLTAMLRQYYAEDADVRVGHVTQIPKDEISLLNEIDKGVDRWYTRNEVRAMKGLEPIDGGDVLFTSFSNIPIESQQNAETPQTNTQASHNHGHIEKTQRNRKEFFNKLDHLETIGNQKYAAALRKLLSKQQDEVLKVIESRDIGKGLQDVAFDGIGFELAFQEETIQINLLQWLLNAFARSGEATMESLGKPSDDFVLREAQRDFFFGSTERLMKSFNEQTALELQLQIGQGLEQGETKAQIKDRIEAVYASAKGYRAERIADTEIHKAVNAATAEVYKEQGYTQLEWESNADACEFCRAMNDTVVAMDQPFVSEGASVIGKDGGEYHNDYMDVKYADLHPNCRCRLVPKA